MLRESVAWLALVAADVPAVQAWLKAGGGAPAKSLLEPGKSFLTGRNRARQTVQSPPTGRSHQIPPIDSPAWRLRCQVQGEQVTAATVTYQCFFQLYPKLAGMTGTARTEEEEFWRLYRMDVVAVPTHRPSARVDMPAAVFRTAAAKWAAVADFVLDCHWEGSPVLARRPHALADALLAHALADALLADATASRLRPHSHMAF